MAVIDETGARPTDLSQYIELIRARTRHYLGDGIDFEPESTPSQIVNIEALGLAEADEVVIKSANQNSIYRARGIALDDLTSILLHNRKAKEFSRVDVLMAGVAGTIIPTGARMRTSTDGDVFATQEDNLIGSSGNVIATVQAVEAGPVPADPGTLTEIVTVISGWETVTNSSEATLGREREKDNIYLRRFENSVGYLSTGSLDAIRSALTMAGAERREAFENDTNANITKQGFVLPPHSIMCIVKGGNDSDLANTIARVKGQGVTTYGGESTDVVSTIVGSLTHGTLSQFQAISDGSFSIAESDFSAVDLSSVTDLAGVATVLQTTIQASTETGYSAATASYDIDHFELTFPSEAQISSFGVHSAMTGTDLSILLGLNDPIITFGITTSNLESISTDRGTINFRRVTEVPIFIALSIDADSDFGANGLVEIKENLVQYANGQWRAGTGQFDIQGFQIGKTINIRRLQSPVNATPGHIISSLEVTISNGNKLPSTPNLDTLYTLSEANISITTV